MASGHPNWLGRIGVVRRALGVLGMLDHAPLARFRDPARWRRGSAPLSSRGS